MSSEDRLPEDFHKKLHSREAAARGFGPTRDDRVVFTNGVFDLIHRGHVTLLYEARQLGDRLIVGLNSDDSTRRLKGAGRPLMPEVDRVACLAALASVDGIVIFEEDTPAEVIAEIQPDVLVKGGDYTVESVVGRNTVLHRGGDVVIIPLLPGRSTTEIIRRAVENHSKNDE